MTGRYRSQLCYAFGTESGAVNPSIPVNENYTQSYVTAEGDDYRTELDEIQDRADTQWPACTNSHLPSTTSIPSRSVYTLYESEPRHAPHLMHGTEDPAPFVSPNASANGYHGPDVIGVADEQLISAQTPPTATQKSCPGTYCQWPSESATGICGVMISCGEVPTHYKDAHGIKNITEGKQLECKWEGCSGTTRGRKNFVRHIRECHLGHHREKGHSP